MRTTVCGSAGGCRKVRRLFDAQTPAISWFLRPVVFVGPKRVGARWVVVALVFSSMFVCLGCGDQTGATAPLPELEATTTYPKSERTVRILTPEGARFVSRKITVSGTVHPTDAQVTIELGGYKKTVQAHDGRWIVHHQYKGS